MLNNKASEGLWGWCQARGCRLLQQVCRRVEIKQGLLPLFHPCLSSTKPATSVHFQIINLYRINNVIRLVWVHIFFCFTYSLLFLSLSRKRPHTTFMSVYQLVKNFSKLTNKKDSVESTDQLLSICPIHSKDTRIIVIISYFTHHFLVILSFDTHTYTQISVNKTQLTK